MLILCLLLYRILATNGSCNNGSCVPFSLGSSSLASTPPVFWYSFFWNSNLDQTVEYPFHATVISNFQALSIRTIGFTSDTVTQATPPTAVLTLVDKDGVDETLSESHLSTSKVIDLDNEDWSRGAPNDFGADENGSAPVRFHSVDVPSFWGATFSFWSVRMFVSDT